MKNAHVLILGTLFITQAVLAGERESFRSKADNRYSHSKDHGVGLGAGGPRPTDLGTGGIKPLVDPKLEYIKEFENYVAIKNWEGAAKVQKILSEKFGYIVTFTRTLNEKDLMVIQEYQNKYDLIYYQDKIGAAELNKYIFEKYQQNLIVPKLSEKDLAVIKEYQTKYDLIYYKDKIGAAELNKYIYDRYEQNLVAPRLTKIEAVQVDGIKLETIKTSREISSEQEMLLIEKTE